VHWVIGRSQLSSLLSTFAVNMMIIGIGTAIWSTSPYNVNFTLRGFTVGAYTFDGNHLAAAVLPSSLGWRWSCFCIAPGPAKPSGPWRTTGKRRS